MQQSLKSFIPFEQKYVGVQVFGYATKGLPGLEVVGLGRYSRNIKEKLIYLTRQEGMVLPKRRYVLCVEQDEEVRGIKDDHLRWLELPLLLLYWTLAEGLSIHQLKNCFCAGKVRLDGSLAPQRFPEGFLTQIQSRENELLFLVHARNNLPDGCSVIELEELLSGRLEFRSCDS